mmetsp:Transcript_26420/g.54790  ORF Transcript_26420/g.54790 Transcript_26420/m.54790 type:complete len:89 (+) Transcript_26420:234-500(+)
MGYGVLYEIEIDVANTYHVSNTNWANGSKRHGSRTPRVEIKTVSGPGLATMIAERRDEEYGKAASVQGKGVILPHVGKTLDRCDHVGW